MYAEAPSQQRMFFNPKGSRDEKYRQQTEVNKADREQAKVQGPKTN